MNVQDVNEMVIFIINEEISFVHSVDRLLDIMVIVLIPMIPIMRNCASFIMGRTLTKVYSPNLSGSMVCIMPRQGMGSERVCFVQTLIGN